MNIAGGSCPLPVEEARWKSAAVFFSGPRSVAGLARRKVTAPAAEAADILRAGKAGALTQETGDKTAIFQCDPAQPERGGDLRKQRTDRGLRQGPDFQSNSVAAAFPAHQAGTRRRAAGEGVEAVTWSRAGFVQEAPAQFQKLAVQGKPGHMRAADRDRHLVIGRFRRHRGGGDTRHRLREP